jgi:cation:H+ antiporter
MILFYLVATDGVISQWDGGLLVIGLIGVMAFLFIDAQRHDRAPMLEDIPDEELDPALSRPWAKTLHIVGGMIFLATGAHLMVRGAVNIADYMGIDHVVIGLTIVAIGTSLPELAASMVGAFKSESDLSVGNVLGSTILNVLFVVGLVALASPMDVEPKSLTVHFPVMLGFSALLLPLAWTQYEITRAEGAMLLTGFTGYLVYLVFPYV